MRIYLNEKISSIPIIRDLLILLKYFYSSKVVKASLVTTDNITARHLYDPVRDFIEYYNDALDEHYDEDTVTYIVNALYMAKGSREVMEMFRELLEVEIKYSYDYPNLNLLEFSSGLQLTDINKFKSKLRTALYYLLFYNKLNLIITEFTQICQFEIEEFESSNGISYRVIVPEVSTTLIRKIINNG